MTGPRPPLLRRLIPGFGATLALLSLLVLLSTTGAGAVGLHSVMQVREAQERHIRLQDLDAEVTGLRGLNQTLLSRVLRRYVTKGPPLAKVPVDVEQLQQVALGLKSDDLEAELRPLGMDEGTVVALQALGTDEYAFNQMGVALLAAPRLTREGVDGLTALAGALDERADQQHRLLTVSIAEASAEQAVIAKRAVQQQAAVSTLLAALLFAVGWRIRRRLVRSLQELSVVAGAVADGDLAARTGSTGNDEIGRLAQALDQMAEALQRAFHELDTEAARQEYRSRVSRALEFVDDEAGLAETVSQTLAVVAPDLPVELLLSDASEAHLVRFARNPLVPAPGCTVTTPWSCPALRSGRTAVFPSSAVIDTCPRLRHRAEGERAAVCVPVAFMGRMLGVMHTATRPGGLPNEVVRGRLQVLGEQFGNRVGNLRAFARVQLQASHDGLTGLPNRRAFEDSVQRLALNGRRYGLLMADLDRFKVVNDTYGHAVGDRALRVFADVLRIGLRPDDLPCRYGGEEFAVALPGLDARAAFEVADRLRLLLADALATDECPGFTVSMGAADSTMGATLSDQLLVADDALLAAKRAGRNRCIIGSPTGRTLFPVGHQEAPPQGTPREDRGRAGGTGGAGGAAGAAGPTLLPHDTRPFDLPTSDPPTSDLPPQPLPEPSFAALLGLTAAAPAPAPVAGRPTPDGRPDADLPLPPPPRHRSPAPPIGAEDLWVPPEDARPAPAGRRVRPPARPRPRSGPPWAATGAVPPVPPHLPLPRDPGRR